MKRLEVKTPEQLAAEGHWNGDEVEGAHERLFDRVEQVRTLRSISLLDAIQVVYAELHDPRWSIETNIYRRWRAERLCTAGVTKAIGLQEFVVWMETGQFIGLQEPPAKPAGLRLASAERQAAFKALMARLDELVQERGMPVGRAVGSLVNQAIASPAEAPCETRRMLQEAMGKGGRRATVVAVAAGLPSIETVVKWYLRHRTGAVELIAPAAKKAKPWRSRKSRWAAEAQRIKNQNPELSDVQVYVQLMQVWRDWWGVPVSRKDVLDKLAQMAWSR